MIHTLKNRKKGHNAKKPKTKRKRQQFPRLTSIQQYPFDSSKQQIVKWTRIPLPLLEEHHTMVLINYEGAFLFHETFFLAFTGLSSIYLVS